MRSTLAHIAVVFFIVYASLFGGVVEWHPILKIVHQLGSAFVVAAWLVSLVLRKCPFPVTRMDGPLWALGGGWLVAALFGEGLRVSFEFIWVTFIHIMLFFIAVDLMRSGKRRWLFEGLFFTGGVVVILGAVEMLLWYFGVPVLPGISGQAWPEVGGFFSIPPVIHELSAPLNHNNPTGAFTVILIPVVLAWSNTSRETDLKWGLRALAAALLGVLILTQSRGAYLALAALVAFMALIWLLRPDVRARFPRRVQPLVSPGVVLALAALGGIVACVILYQVIVAPSHPNPNDVARLDLWYSAVRIFEDYPLTGIGPLQFKGIRLFYGNWDYSQGYLSLDHAHNIVFNILAEGGVLLVALALWVVVRAGRIGWVAWTHAPQSVRRRLEGILAAVLAFSVHNMVDAFIQTQFIVPLAIFLAYTVAHDAAPAPHTAARPRRVAAPTMRFALAATVLVCGQIAFIPIHRGAVKQQQASVHMAQGRMVEALDRVREAQDADPWLDLYVLEEAVILGELAADAPDVYLADAIAAFEDGLQRNAIWDAGWHNLAALYAQAGDYRRAMDAATKAYRIRPPLVDYQLKLGEYYELAGEVDMARAAYREALGDHPWLAASAFWHDPARPDRPAFVEDAIAHYAGTETGISLLVYSGAIERIPTQGDPVPAEVEEQLRVLWPDASGSPCVYCFYVQDNALLLQAETLLHTGPLTPDLADRVETLARKAIFTGASKSEWGWYILVRLAEQQDLTGDEIALYLSRAAAFPKDYRLGFDGVYRMRGTLDILPQARVPVMSPIAYEPWLKLAAWEAGRGNVDEARERYDMILKADPHAPTVPERIADLSASGEGAG